MGFSERPSLLGAVMVCALSEGFERLELKHDDGRGAWYVTMRNGPRNGMSTEIVVSLEDRALEGLVAEGLIAAVCRELRKVSRILRVAVDQMVEAFVGVDMAVGDGFGADETAAVLMAREGDSFRVLDVAYGDELRGAIARGRLDATPCPCSVCTRTRKQADIAFLAELADDPPMKAAIYELLARDEVSVADLAAAARAAAEFDRPLESLEPLALLFVALATPATHGAARTMLRAGLGLEETADMFRVAGRLARRLPPSRRDVIRPPPVPTFSELLLLSPPGPFSFLMGGFNG